ncbi:MAG TPA: hypothetical protein ENK53_08425 [Thiotrichales bacterium]|nr:hypothetical protein [Thiotrichales bacterium]
MDAVERSSRARAAICAAALMLSTSGGAASALSPQDVAALMQAMIVMARLWNQAMGGTGASLGFDWASVLDSSALPYGAWASQPWAAPGLQPWSAMPGAWGSPSPGVTGLPWAGTSMAPWPSGNIPTPWSGNNPAPGTLGAGVSAPPGGAPKAAGPGANRADRLSGLWVAANGTTLWIQDERFILLRGGEVLGLGTLRLQGSQLWMRDARTGASQRYTIRLNAQGLTIRDSLGRAVQYQLARALH